MLTIETFKNYWDAQFPDVRLRRSHFVLAVSGGVDSIVLAHLMHSLKAKCTIAHVNFQLRGAESVRDENFVREFAAKFDLPIQVHTCETVKYAETYKMGIQQAAREIRYAWFGALMQEILIQEQDYTKSALGAKLKPVVLLTAHHADDNVETVLMQLFRGTGIHGLTGIPARRTDVLNMARPLLAFSKADIIAYAAANNLSYVEDSSNEKNDYTRNLIRNQVLPQIAEVYPNVSDNITDTANRLKEAEQIVNDTVALFWKKGFKIKKGIQSIPIAYWNKVKGNATYTWGLVKNYGFKPQQIEEIYKILDANKGAFIASATHRFIKWEDQIQIVSNTSTKEYLTIDASMVGSTIQTQHGTLHFEWIDHSVSENGSIEINLDKDPRHAYLDADKLEWPLLFRTWEPTDYFYPLGLGKKKKLNAFLGNLKLSPSVKSKQAVLCAGDKIVWVVGVRIDDRVKIKPSTQKIVKITWQESF
jgi:tRNA(Ile)-lysidine synthase